MLRLEGFIIALFLFAILIIFVNLSTGCSSGEPSPVLPLIADFPADKAPSIDNGRYLWGIWNIQFDFDKLEATPVPARSLNPHWDITDFLVPPGCPDCIVITVNSWDPVTRIIDTDVTLKNPTPVGGYDVRGILFETGYGHELRNPDDWTALHDIPVGGEINPFKAFAKDEDSRYFAGSAQHTENYIVYIPQPPLYKEIVVAADVSWPGSAKEPYSIQSFSQLTDLYTYEGATAGLVVAVLDWQDDVDSVQIAAPEITGEDFTSFEPASGVNWMLGLPNNMGAPEGEYTARIIATSANSGELALYDYVTITVVEAIQPEVFAINPNHAQAGAELTGVEITGDNFNGPGAQAKLRMSGEPDIPADNVNVGSANSITCDINIPPGANIGLYDVVVVNGSGPSGSGAGLFEIEAPVPDNPVEVTPDWLNFSPNGVAYEDQYAYVAADVNGLHIFDISTASDPEWLIRVETDGDAEDVDFADGYAFVAMGDAGLAIVDVDPVDSASVENTVDTTNARAVCVDGGYAYVADYNSGLRIIDIDPVGDAHVVKTVSTIGNSVDVAVQGGYAGIADEAGGFHIVNIDPPETAAIVKSVGTADDCEGVFVEGDYAYLAVKYEGIQIVKINPPSSADIINTVDTSGVAYKVNVSNGHAFVADANVGLYIINVDPPESAEVVTYVESPGNPSNLVAESQAGLYFIDVAAIDDPQIVGIAPTAGYATGIDTGNGYAYLSNFNAGTHIVLVDPPENAAFADQLNGPGQSYGIAVADGLAYAAAGSAGLVVFDIDPPYLISLLKTVDTGGHAWDVAYENGYAYVADGSGGLAIIDVDPISSASVVKTVATSQAYAVAVDSGYAYIADDFDGVRIIDIDPVDNASVIKTVDTTGDARGIAVAGGYAFVADDTNGLEILVIDPPENASFVNNVPTVWTARDVVVANGYAYVADGYGSGLRIIDVDPVGSAYLLAGLNVPGVARAIAVDANYAYIAAESGGLRIIQLW